MRKTPYMTIIASVLLVSFLTPYPVSAMPPTAEPNISDSAGMKYYHERDVHTLIEELTAAAADAIEQAAAEAAKAATLAALEREAAALSEAARLQREYTELKKDGHRRIIRSALISFAAGVLTGAGALLLIGGGR